MFSLGGISFLFPALLAVAAIIPALWWLLRVMPPRPRAVRFPAFFLLKDLKTDIRTAARTPWWLLLLRSLILLCLILALAEPVLKAGQELAGRYGSVLMVVDNGYAAAAHWDDRMARLEEFLPQISRSKRSVIFLPTAADPLDGKVRSFGPMDPAEAHKFLSGLRPHPWPVNYKDLRSDLGALRAQHRISHSVFLSDGTTTPDGQAEALIADLAALGGVTLVRDDKVNTPYILRRQGTANTLLDFTLERLAPTVMDQNMTLVAHAFEGNVIDEYTFVFPGGATKVDVKWDVLPEMRNRIARVSLRQAPMASAVYITDSQWQQHPVGIVSDGKSGREGFLDETYYLKRALEANNVPTVDTVESLTTQPMSAIVWPDSTALTAVERHNLMEWVQKGGFLIRFAGPNLAGSPDDILLPVNLRYGQRALQGALTWEKPLTLGPIADHSPLLGLSVPEDVTVSRQVLADATPEVFEKTWLQLSDGTPLLTGARTGQGMMVLVHTTAGPDWSNFCYSGLYVEMLQRLISLSTGAADFKGDRILAPMMVLDGFGKPYPPDVNSAVQPIDPRLTFTPSPQTPPGLYGVKSQFKVFNLGNALPQMHKLGKPPLEVTEQTYDLAGEHSMKPDFFRIALWLLLLDTVVTLFLRGILSFSRARAAGIALAAGLVLHVPAAAAQTVDPSDLMTGIYLAYVETGDMTTDRISYNGLMGLKDAINMRTNIKVKGVRGVNPASDELYYYPFLYWPMTEAQTALPSGAARHIQNYMADGGLIVFDTRDQQFAGESGGAHNVSSLGARRLQALTQNLQISELMPVEQGHILTKSFYLLDSFPGQYAGGKIWVEKEPSTSHDGVTSVLIGGNDWAAAWSNAPEDRARQQQAGVSPRQREMALRFGINLAMTALSGNYKADQIHVPYILQRMKK